MRRTLPPIGAMLILAAAMSLALSGCGQKTTEQKEQKSETASSEEKSGEVGCSAGFEKSVAGLKHRRTGTESHEIQGKTLELCCWDQLNSQGQQEKKICCDRVESPVGYASGILWEIVKGTDKMTKSMETYPKDGKSCQQHYKKGGAPGPESCKEKAY